MPSAAWLDLRSAMHLTFRLTETVVLAPNLAFPLASPQIAIVIINVFINLMIASAGYVIPKAQIPKFWQFAYWIK